MVQYLAGIEVLGGIEATDDERARHFRQLSRLTGVTAPEAQAFIDKCKRDPRQWKRIHDRIVQHIAAEQPTEKESGDGE